MISNIFGIRMLGIGIPTLLYFPFDFQTLDLLVTGIRLQFRLNRPANCQSFSIVLVLIQGLCQLLEVQVLVRCREVDRVLVANAIPGKLSRI